MRKRLSPPTALLQPLFPDAADSSGATKKKKRYGRIMQAIWTEDKARFIQQYLRTFVYVTKHGAYIDGFAGLQYEDKPDAWTAALVLASEPKRLRDFFLCELDKKKIKALEQLRNEQPPAVDQNGRKVPRHIFIYPGDFNETVHDILGSGRITQKEATFCLLDQHTFECHWATLRALAAYKKPPNNKIELLYFLGVGWLHRAFSGMRNFDEMEAWWGGSDWDKLPDIRSMDIALLVRERFKQELGYHDAGIYPIFDSKTTNHVMYYMIHASDHEEAPALMRRAHHTAVRALPKERQRPLFQKATS
jgi:three-Cys-motif partner protein